MPAKDIYHDSVKNALIKDGWTVTHDPLRLPWGTKDLYVDLGAKRLVAAQKAEQKIAVEVESFIGDSAVTDLERALGQYILYHDIMAQIEPERVLYLAVREPVFDDLFEAPIGKVLLDNNRIRLIVFNAQWEVITRCIH